MVHSFVTKVSTKKYLPGRSKPLTIRQTSMATKDERIGFRVPREIKTALLQIARKEDRSLAQVCDIFLRAGLHAYQREGSKYIQRFLSHSKRNQ